MGDIKQIRILRLFIVLLLLCNLGLVGTLWLKGSHGPHGRGDQVRAHIIRELRFTPEQVAQYDALIRQHEKGMDEQRELAHGYRNALFSGLSGDHTDSARRDSLAAGIAGAQRQIELVTFDHFARIRMICTPEQKKEFDRIIADVVAHMGGMRPGPGPEGGRDACNPDGPPPPPDGL